MGRGIGDLEKLILIQGYEDGGNLYYHHRGKIRKKLAEIRGIGIKELHDSGSISSSISSSISRAIRNLEKRGLVKRRTYGIWNHSLTEEGMKQGRLLHDDSIR